MKKVHRLVVLPDYQGAGFGIRFLNEVGNFFRQQGYRFTIVTSAPSLYFSLKKSPLWACKRLGRTTEQRGVMAGTASKNRITTSWELIS